MNAQPRVTPQELLGLAAPAAFAGLLHHGFRPLDQYFVQSLGSAAQAALAATTFVVILAYAGFQIVSAGAGPLVARATGANNPDERRALIGSAFAGAAGIAAGCAVLGGGAAPIIASMLGLTGDAHAMAAIYLRVLFLAGPALAFIPVVDAAFHAIGDTRTPLGLRAVALTVNALLTPAFIFGLELGVAGAALGTVLAETLVAVIGATLLAHRVGLRGSDIGSSRVMRMARVGSPVAFGTAMYAGVYWVLLVVAIAPLGEDVTAGLGIGFNVLESISWPIYWGAAVAVSSVVGRRLGAGQPEEAWRAVRLVAWPAAGLGVAFGVAFWLLGPPLVRAMAADPGVYEEGLRYAMILAWSQPFVALEAWSEGVLGGAGDTRKIVWGSVPFNVLRIPLAWALAFPLGWGAAGVWWAITLTSIVKTLVKTCFVLQGRWARLRL